MAVQHNLLAIDVGERRVGVAIANSLARLSSPLTTLINNDNLHELIKELVEKNNITELVIGLPRNLNGYDTKQTEYVRNFSKQLENLNLPIYLEDEALSSVRAKDMLEKSKKNYSKADVDSQAACYILDDFMLNHSEVINV